MEYKVIEWTFTQPHMITGFTFVEPTKAIKQAIINNIRENGYFFDSYFTLSPILNTGEAVEMDYDLEKELIMESYNMDEETYESYYKNIGFNPIDEFSLHPSFNCEFQVKRIVWVNNDSFDSLKHSILNGNTNIDIIPNDYIDLKPNDIIQYKSEDETKMFEVQVKYLFKGKTLSRIKDFSSLEILTLDDLINRFHVDNISSNLNLSYRYTGLKGIEFYNNFEKIYGNTILKIITPFDFDCNLNLIIFDKEIDYKQTILKCPKEIPLADDVLLKIKKAYEEVVESIKRKKIEQNNLILKLKEKMAKKNNNNQ